MILFRQKKFCCSYFGSGFVRKKEVTGLFGSYYSTNNPYFLLKGAVQVYILPERIRSSSNVNMSHFMFSHLWLSNKKKFVN